jgi:hypothetical protein
LDVPVLRETLMLSKHNEKILAGKWIYYSSKCFLELDARNL